MKALGIPVLALAALGLSGCEALFLLAVLTSDYDDDFHGDPNPEVERIPDHEVLGPAPGEFYDFPGGAPVSVTVSGRVTFDRLVPGVDGLSAAPALRPAALVTVEAVSAHNYNLVLRSGATDAAGDYTLAFATSEDYFVRARAVSGAGSELDTVFHPRTRHLIAHAACSAIVHRSTPSPTVNIHAAFDGPSPRAGAFAILETLQTLRAALGTKLQPLGPVDVLWCLGNYYDGAFLELGFTDGTHTNESGPHGLPTITLLGGHFLGGGDHDEYDETVIAHEWASVVQLTQSRDNNFGGSHAGEELIFTASYSEGVVTALGCALLDLREYRDTTGLPPGATGMLFDFDLESGLLPGSGAGYGSEFVVARVVWDLLDGAPGGPADFDSDGVAIVMDDFLSSFSNLSTRGAPYEICWLASLLQQLVDDGHLGLAEADALMVPYGETFPPAGGSDPFPTELQLGAGETGVLNAWGGPDPNVVLGPGANGVWRFTLAAPATVTFELTATAAAYDPAAHALEFSVHGLDRQILALEGGAAQAKTTIMDLPAGTVIVRMQHRPASEAASADSGYSLQAQ